MSRPSLPSYGPWALVAGGSEGLGAAFAAELARAGLNLVLVARRPGPLVDTAARLQQAYPVSVQTVVADLASPGAVEEIAEAVAGLEIGLVIGNAALSPAGQFLAASAADVSAAVDLNCRAMTLLAHRFLPGMVRRGGGGLILMSTLAGLQGVPGLAVYSASKAFLISLGEALWAETRGTGVDVLVSCPGAMTTPRYLEAAARPAPGALPPERVAAVTLAALGHGFRVVPGPFNRMNAFVLARLMPRRTAISVFGRATAAALRKPDSAARSARDEPVEQPGEVDGRDPH